MMAAEVPVVVTVDPFATITLAQPTLTLEIPDEAKYYGIAGESNDYGGYLWITVQTNAAATLSFGGTEAQVVQCNGDKSNPNGTKYPYLKAVKGDDVLGLLPAVRLGHTIVGSGPAWARGPYATWTTGAGNYMATVAVPAGVTDATLSVTSALRQTPTGAYAPSGIYNATLLVTISGT
jgi:hypothetical protein